MMLDLLLSRLRFGSVILLGALACVVLTIAGFLRTDRVVEDGWKQALSEAAPLPQTGPMARSEAEWLRETGVHASFDATSPWKLAPGDRITVHTGGREHILEVAEVREVSSRLTQIDTRPKTGRFWMVVCREPSRPDLPVVRLLLDDSGTWPEWLMTVPASTS